MIAMSEGTKEKLLAGLETEILVNKKTTGEIPAFIKTFLAGFSSTQTFDVADPGKEWQEDGWVNGFDDQKKGIVNATASIAKPFPTKQLVYCGIGKNKVLLSYYTGGIRMTQHMFIIKFEGEKIIDLWFDHHWYDYQSDFVISKKDNIIQYIKKKRNDNC